MSTANQRDFIRLSSRNNPHKPHTRRHEDELKICESIKTLKWTGRDGTDWTGHRKAQVVADESLNDCAIKKLLPEERPSDRLISRGVLIITM